MIVIDAGIFKIVRLQLRDDVLPKVAVHLHTRTRYLEKDVKKKEKRSALAVFEPLTSLL